MSRIRLGWKQRPRGSQSDIVKQQQQGQAKKLGTEEEKTDKEEEVHHTKQLQTVIGDKGGSHEPAIKECS